MYFMEEKVVWKGEVQAIFVTCPCKFNILTQESLFLSFALKIQFPGALCLLPHETTTA